VTGWRRARAYLSGVSRWREVADDVFQRRYDPLDISICVVRGRDGLMLVDTRRTPREADEIRADLRELGDLDVTCVVNTHAHFDHTFGNQRFGPGSDVDVPIYGHHLVPAHLEEFERPELRLWIEQQQEGVGDWEDWNQVVLTPPTELVESRLTLDVGERIVELVHFGRGHTDNDLLVHIPDARTWLAGDVVEESGPPMYGSGCFPLEWPETVGALHSALTDDAVVVPGHGHTITRDYVNGQLDDLRTVAELIRALHAAGIPESEALAEGAGRWPFPAAGLLAAVNAGYLQLSAPDAG
jgi:glyoxylase-like metal-dependent hydrolase (beta-lactamase superfamily II)